MAHKRWLAIAFLGICWLAGPRPQTLAQAEPLAVEWERTFGDGWDQSARCVRQTDDGGYIVAGSSLMKIDAFGELTWEEGIAGNCVGQTGDGYVVLEASLVITDEEGNEVSATDFGNVLQVGNSIERATGGGYVVAGRSREQCPDTEYVVNLDTQRLARARDDGTFLWERDLIQGNAYAVQETSDDAYIVAGSRDDLGCNSYGDGPQFSLVKADRSGEIIWDRKFGLRSGAAHAVEETPGGDYIAAGWANDDEYDRDVYIVKTSANGELIRERRLARGAAYSMAPTGRGTYLIAGEAEPPDSSGSDVYVAEIDGDGEPLWEATFGGDGDDAAYSICATRDGGCVVAGYTRSSGAGGSDVYLLKLGSSGMIPGDCNRDGAVDISDGICLLGYHFLSIPDKLPCGGRTLGDPANASLLDFNGDGGVDLSDPISLFSFLFLGGPPHALGTDCTPIPGCVGVCAP
jgi:hypothetical protein